MALLGLVVGLGCVVLLAFLSVTEAELKDAAEKIG